MIVEKRNSIILVLLIICGSNVLAQLPIKEQKTITDTLISKSVTITLYGKYKRNVTKYDEGIFIDYSFQDGSSLTLFQGALQKIPLLSNTEGYRLLQIDTIKKRIIHRGEVEAKVWREDQLEGIRIYYDKVPLNKRSLYEYVLNSICVSPYILKNK